MNLVSSKDNCSQKEVGYENVPMRQTETDRTYTSSINEPDIDGLHGDLGGNGNFGGELDQLECDIAEL